MGPLRGREARQLVRALGAASVTVVETEGARAAATRALVTAGAGELARRLEVVPNPVAEAFVLGDVSQPREQLVVAVGRWHLRVKGAALLGAALGQFLESHPDHRAVIVGRGAGAGPSWEDGRPHRGRRAARTR